MRIKWWNWERDIIEDKSKYFYDAQIFISKYKNTF